MKEIIRLTIRLLLEISGYTLLGAFIGMCLIGISEQNDKLKENKELLGKKVVLDADTLTVIDYDTYNIKLSNNIELPVDLAKTLLAK